ncbi:MAG: bifunctional glutamate N-acetyltransferase/amino-acid acetyltransferase ArgJ, partial [Gemmatimonadota bacterium]
PRGFRAAGIHCGVKKAGKPDLALLYSEEEGTTAAATFTTNQVRAAPVRYCEEAIADGHARAIVVNSGNANACTGDQGMANAREMAILTADALAVEPAQVLVASTGIIGEQLPMEFLRDGISRVAMNLEASGASASEAILTTDSFTKTISATVEAGGTEVTIGGMAKGAGMIHPRMATMLGFLTTDARIPPKVLRRALKEAVDVSFNRITVDGDTSTNDAVFLLANGAAAAPAIEGGVELEAFAAALAAVAKELARMIPLDGEGAHKLIEVRVDGARTVEEGARCAERVANSLLVKTAIRGGDSNWGRIMAAVGSAGVPVREERIAMWVGDVQLVRNGIGVPGSIGPGRAVLSEETVLLRIDLGLGEESASVWTCDLGEEYIQINTQYN